MSVIRNYVDVVPNAVRKGIYDFKNVSTLGAVRGFLVEFDRSLGYADRSLVRKITRGRL